MNNLENSPPDMIETESGEPQFNKCGLYVVIDKRERAIIPHFKTFQSTYGIPYFVEHMTTGDIAICYRGHILLIIERKTWVDLGASIKDGRKNNVENLLLLRKNTSCQIAYLIEGLPCPKPNSRYARIPYKSLRAHLDHLAFRNTIHMIYATSCQCTAQRVFEVARNFGTIKPSVFTQIDELLDVPKSEGGLITQEAQLRTKHTSSDQLIQSNMWCAIPCITDKTVGLFMENRQIRDVLLGNIPKQDISVMKYASGIMVGMKRASIICKSAKQPAVHAKILAAIPSITLKTAKKILLVLPITELLSTNPDEKILSEKIANIKKTEKSKVGRSAARKIMKFLN
jgi:ERCC4-type nuclease